MPRTRCSRASSSTSGSAPRLGISSLSFRRHGVRLGGHLGVGGGGLGLSGVGLHCAVLGGVSLGRVSLGRAVLSIRLGRAVLSIRLGRAVLSVSLFLGSAVLGSAVLGGLCGPGAAGLALLGVLGLLGRQALLGGSGEGILLVRARRGDAESAFGARLALELLPVTGDLEQDANRVRRLRADGKPALK